MRYSDPRLVDQLASAYVLGTLSARARRRFERLRGHRTDVAMAVAQWEARLGQLAQAVPPVEPAARVWHAIESRTRATALRAPRGERSAWLRLTGWGVGGLIAGAGVALSALMVAPTFFVSADQAAMHGGEKLPQSYVGLLTDAEGNGKVLVSSLRHGRVMTVKVIGPLQPLVQGRHMVLWAVPPEGTPFVLGTVPVKGSSVSRLPDTSEKLLSKVGKLVVTLETSETPAAPGDVLLRGNCAKLW